MHGWFTVAAVAGLQLAAAVLLMRRGARRWWDYAAIAALTVLLIRPALRLVAGDVSAVLPHGAFAEGALGKDQIIIASALTTVLLPLLVAAAIVWGFNRLLRGRRGD